MSRASMLNAPRILKAPIGCRFSHLTWNARPLRAGRRSCISIVRSTSGVRRATPLMRAAAASMSASEVSVTGDASIIVRMRALAAALLLAGAPGLAVAQQQQPPPPVFRTRPVSGFVVDARGVLAKFGQRPITATSLGATAADLPGPGLGGAAGAHVYPLRVGPMAIG